MVVVRQGGVRAPLRPLSLLVSPSVFKKPVGRRVLARRNLFGSAKDSGENLRIVQESLESSASDFASRWGFDPVTEVPLEGGRYTWTPLTANTITPHSVKPATPLNPANMDSNTERGKEGSTSQTSPLTIPVRSLAPMINNLSLDHEKIDGTRSNPGESTGEPQGKSIHSTPQSLKPGTITPSEHKPRLRQTKITEYGRIMKRRKKRELIKRLL